MTWSELGGLGEAVGALAVVVSLFYVARQLRDNTRSTRLSMLQSTSEAAVLVYDAPTRDPALARAIRRAALQSGPLSDEDMGRLIWWLASVFRLGENAFLQHEAGIMDDETWRARAASIESLLAIPAFREIWDLRILHQHAGFVAWFEARMRSLEKKHARVTPPPPP